LSWHRLPGDNKSAEDSGATSGASDAIPVFDDDGDQDDAMTQSCALDRWAASLPHIDSDVSDDDDDGYCCEYESQEYATGLVLPEFTSCANPTRPGAQPTNIVQPEQTEPTAIKGRIFSTVTAATLSLSYRVHLDFPILTNEDLEHVQEIRNKNAKS